MGAKGVSWRVSIKTIAFKENLQVNWGKIEANPTIKLMGRTQIRSQNWFGWWSWCSIHQGVWRITTRGYCGRFRSQKQFKWKHEA